jgi:hypothetical protein
MRVRLISLSESSRRTLTSAPGDSSLKPQKTIDVLSPPSSAWSPAGASQTKRVSLSSESSTFSASTAHPYSSPASRDAIAAHGSGDSATARAASAVETLETRSAAASGPRRSAAH